ncbi:hypothetical protein [Caldibacillus debilis]|uniref:hypothetical protein n=1 Tax=Caldibacillus debilis TaxID=301148 RepID=UPI000E3907CD|nr:hypothetical protein [Caldibacillus debilis]REJ29272.1 MAG: hypothetical protein C6W56_05955 [Caldibacillus debilis]
MIKIYFQLYDKNGEETIVSHNYNGELKDVETYTKEYAKEYLKDFYNIDEVKWEIVEVRGTGLLSRTQSDG